MLRTIAVYDNKAKVFQMPTYFLSLAQAKQEFTIFINHENQKELNPIDYELYNLGEYDQSNGKFKLLEAPEHICSLKALVQEKPKTEKVAK